MKRNYFPGPRLKIDNIISIENGGTNANNLVDARNNLKIVSKSKIGQPNGLIPLDQFGRFPSWYLDGFVFSTVDLDGPKKLSISETGVYKITNMDSRISYSVRTVLGSVFINEDTITYIAPDSHVNGGGFYVNSSYYTIDVLGPVKIPNKPSITSPAINTTINVNNIVFVSSAWSSIYPEDYLATVEWEFSSNEDFSSPIDSNIVIEKLGYIASLSNIPPDTTIYGRVRHKGYYGYWSEWSDSRLFSRPVEQKPIKPNIFSPSLDGVTHESNTTFVSSNFETSLNGDLFLEALWQVSSNINFVDNLQEFKKTDGTYFNLNIETVRDRSYFVRVKHKSISNWESDWSNIRSVMYVPIEPAQRPTIIGPGINTVVTIPSTVITASNFSAISPGDLIDESQWQVAKDGSFSNLLTSENKSGENYNSFTMTGMIPGDTYFFRVRYKGTSGWFSEWSLVRSITYGTVTKPSIISPEPGTERLKQTVSLFSSEFNVVGLTSFHASSDWQISLNETFTEIVNFQSESTINKTSWTVTDLEFGKTYYARVRHRTNGNIISEWSNSVMFKTRNSSWSPLKLADIETGSNRASLSVNNDGTLFAVSNRIYRMSEAGVTLVKTISNSEAFGIAENFLSLSTVIGKAITINESGNSLEVVFSAYIPDAIGAVPKSLLAYSKYGYANGIMTRIEHYVTGNPLVEISEDYNFEATTPIHNFEVVGVQAVGENNKRLIRLKSATGGNGVFYSLIEKKLSDSFIPNEASDTYAIIQYPEINGKMYTVTLQAQTPIQPQRQQTPNGYFENEVSGTLLEYYKKDILTPSMSMSIEVAEAIANLNISGQWMNADMTLLMSLQGSRLLIYSNN